MTVTWASPPKIHCSLYASSSPWSSSFWSCSQFRHSCCSDRSNVRFLGAAKGTVRPKMEFAKVTLSAKWQVVASRLWLTSSLSLFKFLTHSTDLVWPTLTPAAHETLSLLQQWAVQSADSHERPHLTQVLQTGARGWRETPQPRSHTTLGHCNCSDSLNLKGGAGEEEPWPSEQEHVLGWSSISTSSPEEEEEEEEQTGYSTVSVGVCFAVWSLCVMDFATWAVQNDSSEWPMNPGFHDSVTLLSTIFRTCNSTGAAGSTKPRQSQKKYKFSQRWAFLRGVMFKSLWCNVGICSGARLCSRDWWWLTFNVNRSSSGHRDPSVIPGFTVKLNTAVHSWR